MPYQAEICDDNGDGFAEFDLTNFAVNLLVGPAANIEFEYYLDEALTQTIDSPEAYTNISNPQIVYVKIIDTSSTDLCESVEELTLFVDEFPGLNNDNTSPCAHSYAKTEIAELKKKHIVLTDCSDLNNECFNVNNAFTAAPTPHSGSVSTTLATITVKITVAACC